MTTMTDYELITEFIKVLPAKDFAALQQSCTEEALKDDLRALLDYRLQFPELKAEVAQPALIVCVCSIAWQGSHTPISTWIKIAELPEYADAKAIHAQVQRALKLKTYFNTCEACGNKNPTGWMEGTVCHSCLEKEGIVF